METKIPTPTPSEPIWLPCCRAFGYLLASMAPSAIVMTCTRCGRTESKRIGE